MISKLNTPARCSLFTDWMQQCRQEAHWIVDGEFVCDEHIEGMAQSAGFHDEDDAFLQRALDDIAQRKATQGKQGAISAKSI